MIIGIPSRSRAERLSAGLILQIPSRWLHHTVVFVPESQYYDYIMHLPGSVQVVGLPEHMRIAETREAMANWTYQNDEKTVFMIDDDVGFLVRKGPDDWRLMGQNDEDFEDMILAAEDLLHLQKNPYSHIGVSMREGNNRIGVGDKPLIKDFTRVCRAMFWRVDDFLQLEHGRVPVMEDFDLSLQSLRLGRRNGCMFYWAQGQGQTGDPGGCSDYRDTVMQEAASRRLAELHPGLIQLVTQTKKTGGAISSRVDVQIQWKRAWTTSQEWSRWTAPESIET